MSDQGFSEIQLSGKQLVFLFMSAVVVLVVVFLLGVAVGRSVRDAAGDTPVSADAGLPETVVPDDAARADSAKPADPELSYHDMLVGAPAATPAASPTSTPTPVPETAPPPVAESAPPATAAAEARTAGWFLQTGAFSTREVADGQAEKLKQLKVPAFVLAPEPGSPMKLFRVRVGPYTDRAEAAEVSSRLQRQGYTPSITR